MDREEFLARVAQYAALPAGQDAETVATTVLTTLGQRLSGGQGDDLAAYLPLEMAAALKGTGGQAGPFDRDEFLTRIADQEGVDTATADHHARAVLRTAGEAVPDAEVDDTFAQLPGTLTNMFA